MAAPGPGGMETEANVRQDPPETKNKDMGKGSILFPLPDYGFDTTEAAVAWRLLTDARYTVVFATERGAAGPVPQCDELLLTGVLCGQLGADPEPKLFYEQMTQSFEFRHPIAWDTIEPRAFAGLYLSGGHDKGMRQYLGSEVLQNRVAAFWALNRPVAAVCHGPILLARAIDENTKRSVLHGRSTMALPKYMEQSAHWLVCCCLGDYYRTYDEYVQDEIGTALGDPHQFRVGTKPCVGVPARGTMADDSPAEVHVDGNYVSGRWPGDVYLLAKTFIKMLEGSIDGLQDKV